MTAIRPPYVVEGSASSPTWEPRVLCECGTEVHDNATAKELHSDNWHSARYPASYRTAAPGGPGLTPS
ncbi:hypothetical protein ACVW0K_007339 [Streptomyces filamentosus]